MDSEFTDFIPIQGKGNRSELRGLRLRVPRMWAQPDYILVQTVQTNGNARNGFLAKPFGNYRWEMLITLLNSFKREAPVLQGLGISIIPLKSFFTEQLYGISRKNARSGIELPPLNYSPEKYSLFLLSRIDYLAAYNLRRLRDYQREREREREEDEEGSRGRGERCIRQISRVSRRKSSCDKT